MIGGEYTEMTELTERKLGWGFGLLGAALMAVAGILSLAFAAFDVAAGRTTGAMNSGTEALLLLVIAGLALLFAYLGHGTWSGQPLASGVLLVVIAALAWGVLGLGANVVALIGALFVFLAGVLYLVGPAVQGVKTLATA